MYRMPSNEKCQIGLTLQDVIFWWQVAKDFFGPQTDEFQLNQHLFQIS